MTLWRWSTVLIFTLSASPFISFEVSAETPKKPGQPTVRIYKKTQKTSSFKIDTVLRRPRIPSYDFGTFQEPSWQTAIVGNIRYSTRGELRKANLNGVNEFEQLQFNEKGAIRGQDFLHTYEQVVSEFKGGGDSGFGLQMGEPEPVTQADLESHVQSCSPGAYAALVLSHILDHEASKRKWSMHAHPSRLFYLSRAILLHLSTQTLGLLKNRSEFEKMDVRDVYSLMINHLQKTKRRDASFDLGLTWEENRLLGMVNHIRLLKDEDKTGEWSKTEISIDRFPDRYEQYEKLVSDQLDVEHRSKVRFTIYQELVQQLQAKIAHKYVFATGPGDSQLFFALTTPAFNLEFEKAKREQKVVDENDIHLKEIQIKGKRASDVRSKIEKYLIDKQMLAVKQITPKTTQAEVDQLRERYLREVQTSFDTWLKTEFQKDIQSGQLKISIKEKNYLVKESELGAIQEGTSKKFTPEEQQKITAAVADNAFIYSFKDKKGEDTFLNREIGVGVVDRGTEASPFLEMVLVMSSRALSYADVGINDSRVRKDLTAIIQGKVEQSLVRETVYLLFAANPVDQHINFGMTPGWMNLNTSPRGLTEALFSEKLYDGVSLPKGVKSSMDDRRYLPLVQSIESTVGLKTLLFIPHTE